MRKRELIEEFTSHYNLNIPSFLKRDEDGVVWLLETQKLVAQEILAKIKVDESFQRREPTWAITQAMLDRVAGHVSGCFITLFTGAWASTEVVCRSAIEAAVNVIYTVKEDRNNRVSQYFKHYFEGAEAATQKYEKLAVTTSPQATVQYQEMARQNQSGARTRKQLMEMILQNEGIPSNVPGWPRKIIERFRRINMEHVYHEFYATLSSEAHNDASSLVDYMLMKCVRLPIQNAEQYQAEELLFWVRTYVYRALLLYLYAVWSYAQAYALDDAPSRIANIRASVEKHLIELNADFSCTLKDVKEVLGSQNPHETA